MDISHLCVRTLAVTYAEFRHRYGKATHWINTWVYLFPEEQRGHMDSGCTRLMVVVQAIYNRVVGGISTTYKGTNLIGYIKSQPLNKVNQTV
jgi:hypothetical protein